MKNHCLQVSFKQNVSSRNLKFLAYHFILYHFHMALLFPSGTMYILAYIFLIVVLFFSPTYPLLYCDCH